MRRKKTVPAPKELKWADVEKMGDKELADLWDAKSSELALLPWHDPDCVILFELVRQIQLLCGLRFVDKNKTPKPIPEPV